MSPEQIASARSVDARSDVWALGVILYEMLAGARPFGGDSVMEICRAIDRGTYPKLSELRDDVPALLDEVVSAALAREANMRLASVEAFGARIAPFGTKAARDSYEKVRRIATRASRAPAQPSDGGGGVPAGASGVPTAATGAGNFTERGVARSEDRPGVRPRPPRRWRWAAGTGVAAAAVAVTAFFARGGHVPWGRATAGATGCAARGVAACEAECAARDPESCFQLAKILDDGKDAPRDVVRASTLYQVGCDGSVARACNNLGALYAAGDGVARSPTKAVDLFERSCNLGFALACANLGTMHFEGKGLPKDVATGAIWFFRACEGGAALGCFNASIAYGEGKGAAKDPKQSFAYAERACKGGMVLGCIRVETARIHGEGVPKDVQGGLERLDALCTHEAEACESLIPIYNMGIGTDVPADPLQVRAYAKKACDLGDEKACHLDRLLLTVDKGRTPDGKNNEMYATKCDAGDLLGCALLGEDLVDGRGVSVDRARGTMLLERACQGKVERACSRLAAAATSSPTASPASSAPSSTASPAPDGRR
jgi:hypothetical protein